VKRNFITVEQGTTYDLPKYRVVDGVGIVPLTDTLLLKENKSENVSYPFYQTITFVRGDKTDNGKVIERVDGILHETLLAMMIADLKYKNGLVPNKHTACAITHLEDALFRLEERVREREINGTIGTYK